MNVNPLSSTTAWRRTLWPHVRFGIMFAHAHVAMEDADRRALGVIWRERLENARVRYEAAKAAVQDARELQSQISSPDGSFTLDHALRAEHHALAEFKRVLAVFNDLVVNGKIPDED